MSRLIDAEKLRDEIKNMIHPMSTPDGTGMYDMEINAYNEAIVDVMETINKQPTVEVPETRKWIPADQPPRKLSC